MGIVDLFVRSWVEMWNITKFLPTYGVDLFVRSWVEINAAISASADATVDLFVRSWVEIYGFLAILDMDSLSTSSWGRELKFFAYIFCIIMYKSTSSWGRELKYTSYHLYYNINLSTSSWGRELKWNDGRKKCDCRSRPLREVVSWNNVLALQRDIANRRPLREVVSWNFHEWLHPA